MRRARGQTYGSSLEHGLAGDDVRGLAALKVADGDDGGLLRGNLAGGQLLQGEVDVCGDVERVDAVSGIAPWQPVPRTVTRKSVHPAMNVPRPQRTSPVGVPE